MAGHSHWAGIKHKKGRQDKQRSKLFSKLSREITVAAKLGDKDPDINPRLRSAIQAAKQSNMPKENTKRKNNAKIPKYKNTHEGNIIFCLHLRKQLQEPAVLTDAKSKKFFVQF